MIVSYEFNLFLEEAEINYNNQRYRDSASAFEYLIRDCTKNKNFLDALHFSYRAIDAWEKAGYPQKAMRVWHNLGLFALKVASSLASDSAKSSDNPEIKAQTLEILQESLVYLHKTDQRLDILDELYVTYIQLSDEFDRTIQEKISFLDKALQFPEILTDERVEFIEKKLADLHFQLAQEYSKSGSPEHEEIAKRELKKANMLYSKYGKSPRLL